MEPGTNLCGGGGPYRVRDSQRSRRVVLTMEVNPYLMEVNPYLMEVNPYLMEVNPYLMEVNPYLMEVNPYLMEVNPHLNVYLIMFWRTNSQIAVADGIKTYKQENTLVHRTASVLLK